MKRDLRLPFTILSDSRREVITKFGLLNAREKGGIAIPATIVIDRSMKVLFASGNEVHSRVQAADALAWVRSFAAGNEGKPPRARILMPGAMFLRAMVNG